MWVKVDDQFPSHAKVAFAGSQLGEQATGRVLAIWLEAQCWAAQHLTDGFVPRAIARAFTHDRQPLKVLEAMCVVPPWAKAGLYEKVEGGYLVHDFGLYSPTAEQVRVKRAIRAKAGAQGGRAKAAKQTASKMPESWQESATDLSKQTSSKRVANVCPVPVPVPVQNVQTSEGERVRTAPAGAPPPANDNGHRPKSTEAADVFQALWNDRTVAPLPRCRDLTPGRRKKIALRLKERCLTEWSEVFAHIQASAFCRGENDRGWRASFDWIVENAENAVKVLEGKYDDLAHAPPPVATAEMARAIHARKNIYHGCPHEPKCDSYEACLTAIVRHFREEAVNT